MKNIPFISGISHIVKIPLALRSLWLIPWTQSETRVTSTVEVNDQVFWEAIQQLLTTP